MRTNNHGERQGLIAESLARSFEGGSQDYEVSESYAEPERRKFLGEWTVVSHQVGEEAFIDRFAAGAVKGAFLREAVYWSSYTFRGRICVKRVEIDGSLEGPEGPEAYAYRLGVALAWEPGPSGRLKARPELGYMASWLGGRPVAVKELEQSREDLLIGYAFEGAELRFVEGDDVKVLRRTR